MLEQICAFIHNFFHGDRYAGTFKVENGTLAVDGLVNGQYFRICGSHMNDGVYQYPPYGLYDETFNGVIWEMRPPKMFLDLVAEIEAWNAKYGEAVSGPYQSESFGGYSYTLKSRATASGQPDNSASSWQGAFKPSLNQWRKLA